MSLASSDQTRPGRRWLEWAALPLLLLWTLGCQPPKTTPCEATFLDAKGGNVLGKLAIEIEADALAEALPEEVCLKRSTPKAPEGMKVTHCVCDDSEASS